jgi:hypothetical protein
VAAKPSAHARRNNQHSHDLHLEIKLSCLIEDKYTELAVRTCTDLCGLRTKGQESSCARPASTTPPSGTARKRKKCTSPQRTSSASPAS